MTIITRKIEFDAGHRVLGHEGKCRNLHGHRYVAEIAVSAKDLDSLGRVIDFGVIKDVIGGWIDEYWDHNMILHPDDPLFKIGEAWDLNGIEVIVGRDPYVMPGGNPTAENLARVLHDICCELLPDYLMVVYVKIWETPNCSATYFGEFEEFFKAAMVSHDS